MYLGSSAVSDAFPLFGTDEFEEWSRLAELSFRPAWGITSWFGHTGRCTDPGKNGFQPHADTSGREIGLRFLPGEGVLIPPVLGITIDLMMLPVKSIS